MKKLLILSLFLTGCSSTGYEDSQINIISANAEILKEREKTKQAKFLSDKIKVECPNGCTGLKVEIPTSGFGGQNDQEPLLAMPKAPKNIFDNVDTLLHIADRNTGMFTLSKVAVEGIKALKGSGEDTINTTTIINTKTTTDNSTHSKLNMDFSQREENHDSKNDSSQVVLYSNNDSSQHEENHDSKNDNSVHDSHDSEDNSSITTYPGTSP